MPITSFVLGVKPAPVKPNFVPAGPAFGETEMTGAAFGAALARGAVLGAALARGAVLGAALARGAWEGSGGGGAALPAPTAYLAVAITLPALSPIRTVY